MIKLRDKVAGIVWHYYRDLKIARVERETQERQRVRLERQRKRGEWKKREDASGITAMKAGTIDEVVLVLAERIQALESKYE